MQLGRVRDHRLGDQHARRTHTIAALNFLQHIDGPAQKTKLGHYQKQTWFRPGQDHFKETFVVV
jgi:hypothetical protein